MVKETNWSKEGLFESQGFRRNKKQGGMWELEDLPTVINRFIFKITNKRLQIAEEKLKEILQKETDRLFLIISNVSVNRLYDYWDGSPFTNKIWERLGSSYIKKKGHQKFWFYKGKLNNWLRDTLPSEVFGMPRVEIHRNLRAKGFQNMQFTINPWPNSRRPKITDEAIRNRLFGRHKWNGIYMSNEEGRPIISPAMRALLKNRITERVTSTLKETLENG